MILSRIASKRNTLWALLLFGVVIVLCGGEQTDSQTLAANLGPLESTEAQAEPLGSTVGSPTASEPLGDCDQTEPLLKAQTLSADAALPTCLLLMWLIAGWLRRASPPRPPFDPIGSPLRRHLVFCVFRE